MKLNDIANTVRKKLFKPGTLIRCMDPGDHMNLLKGDLYRVYDCYKSNHIKLVGREGFWFTSRFKVENEAR